jgi:hypothetical protein
VCKGSSLSLVKCVAIAGLTHIIRDVGRAARGAIQKFCH